MDVNLWFARNQNNEIISIINSNKNDEYICPICTSKVIPKALESKKKSPHFAHTDVSKCNGEAMIHWWYKNKFIQKGDKFKIFTDKEIEFICKDFKTEVTYQLESGTYRPDLVVETECGQEIIFEMANTNKKMVKDYIDRWIELDKIIVEVDIKSLQNVDEIKKFSALYYNGKCFNFNKRDGGYYNTIGKLKEEMKSNGKYDIEMVKKLDWFWSELSSYLNKTIKSDKFFIYIGELLRDYNTGTLVTKILKNKKCTNILDEFINHMYDDTKRLMYNYTNDIKFVESVSIGSVLYEPIIRLNYYKGNIETLNYLSCTKENILKLYSYYSFLKPIVTKLASLLDDKVVNIKVKQKNTSVFCITIYSNKTTKHYEISLNGNFIHRIYPRYDEYFNLYEGVINENIISEIISENFISDLELRERKCFDCKEKFNVSYEEYKFFRDNNLQIPKRCKSCRNKRKKERLND